MTFDRHASLSRQSASAAISFILLLTTSAGAAQTPQPLPAYVQTDKASGTAVSVGSRTMALLMSDWVVQFKRFHPDAKFLIQHSGSDEGPTALLNGSANFASIDRSMSEDERRAFVEKFGYAPTGLRVAVDAIAVFVHKDNPIAGMTVPQLDAVFSGTRHCGYKQNFTSWDQLGLGAKWKNRPFRLFGRDRKSTVHAFFAERALCKGKFRDDIQAYEKSRDVTRFVAAEPEALGYTSLLNIPNDVRILPIAAADGKPFVAPTPENIGNETYPLSQFLYIYVNKSPTRPLATVEREFLKMVLSSKGQALTNNNGFMPMSASAVRDELAKLN